MATRFIASKVVALELIVALAASPASAEGKSSKEEAAGVGVGAVIGAAAGGPMGFIVGAAAGAWFGDQFHQKKQEVSSLSVELKSTEAELGQLEQAVSSLQSERQKTASELAQLRTVAKPELLSLLRTGIEMDLLFRTDESVLADTTSARLQQLAATLSTMPDVQVQLDGFADERGDATYNHKLSTERADYVRSVLVEAGVSPTRIKVAAHGESPAVDDSIDSYALERRVSLTLYVDDNPSFASNPTQAGF
jgi:outer membrane protein OmpA-like peptidoglycan-associated protein